VADAVLVVDDEPRILESLGRLLEREGFRAHLAKDGREADAILAREPELELALLDVALPGEDGLTLLKRWLAARPALHVVLMSGHGTIEMAVEATRLGAFDFLEKPLSSDRVMLALRNASRQRNLERENAALRESAGLASTLVGRSQAIHALLERIALAAPTAATVLVTGESGTGKEMVARAVHHAGPRAKKPFLGLNCGAIPANLLESELFGSVKGAFTGADRDRRGLFQEADGGTLLLDEVGEMSTKMQAGLLRVLEEKRARPVGGVAEEPVDVRVIAATHRDLAQMVSEGSFREDLMYRLHVVELHVPALRERVEDIPPLIDHFLSLFSARYRRERKPVSRDALRKLCAFRWPGNVRQLEHVLLSAWLMSRPRNPVQSTNKSASIKPCFLVCTPRMLPSGASMTSSTSSTISVTPLSFAYLAMNLAMRLASK